MTSPLLINESPLQALPSLACLLGINPAIILQQIHYWSVQPRIGIEKDGRRWVYNSARQWQEENFPWLSVDSVGRILRKLEEDGYLESDVFNESTMDTTKWYTINYEHLNEGLATTTGRPGVVAKSHNRIGKIHHAIPETTSKEQAGLKKDQLGSGKQKKEPAHSNQPVADQPVRPDKPTSSGQLDITSATSVTQTVGLLAEAFSLKTGIPVPNPVSQRNWAAYNVRWGGPLRNLLNLCQTYGNTVTLMNKAIDRMRADKLTISAPQSIEQVAIAIYGENKGGRTGYW